MSVGPERRTVKGWVHRLTEPDAELTLSELMALCLIEIRDNVLTGREASEHTEGMLGAIDDWLARLAELNGLPYAADAESRAALHAARRKRLHDDDAARLALGGGAEL